MVALREAALVNFGRVSYDTLHMINAILPTALNFENAIPAIIEGFGYEYFHDGSPVINPNCFCFQARLGNFLIRFDCSVPEIYIYERIENEHYIRFKGKIGDLEEGIWAYSLNTSFGKATIKNIKTIIYLIESSAQEILIKKLLNGSNIAKGRDPEGSLVIIPKSVFSSVSIKDDDIPPHIDWRSNTISTEEIQWSDVVVSVKRQRPYPINKYINENLTREIQKEITAYMNAEPCNPIRKLDLILKYKQIFNFMTTHELKMIWRSALRAHRLLHPESRWDKPGKRSSMSRIDRP